MHPRPTTEQLSPPARALGACTRHAPHWGEATRGRLRVNYRYYNLTDGRWLRRDPYVEDYPRLLCIYVGNSPCFVSDYLGEKVSKDMSVAECNREANAYLQQLIKQYRSLDGCNITIKCECNSKSYAVTSGQDITVRLPKSSSAGETGFKNTIRHEVFHAFHNCKNRPIIDCESMLFSEIRGSYYGQCAQVRPESERKKCTKNGVKRSITGNLKALEEESKNNKNIDMSKWNCLKDFNDNFETAYQEMKKNPEIPFI